MPFNGTLAEPSAFEAETARNAETVFWTPAAHRTAPTVRAAVAFGREHIVGISKISYTLTTPGRLD